jgi:hypothetical protein
MAFPGLFMDGGSAHLPAERKAEIYDDGIIPALTQVAPEDVQNWPPTYKDSLFRARNRTGTHQFGTKALASWEVDDFIRRLTESLSQRHDWAREAVFITQIKGVKEAHRHNPNPRDSDQALTEFLSGIDASEGTWFVDVGLEISEPTKAYQWRTDSHATIIRHTLSVSHQAAIQSTNVSSRNYSRDLSSHILDLAGCRVQLVTERSQGPHRARYVQLYTTDKAVVYHLEKGRHSKFMTGYEALNGTPPKFITDLYHAFYNARESLDCAARIEIRVPLQAAKTVLQGIPPEVLERSIVVYPRKVWWCVTNFLPVSFSQLEIGLGRQSGSTPSPLQLFFKTRPLRDLDLRLMPLTLPLASFGS